MSLLTIPPVPPGAQAASRSRRNENSTLAPFLPPLRSPAVLPLRSPAYHVCLPVSPFFRGRRLVVPVRFPAFRTGFRWPPPF